MPPIFSNIDPEKTGCGASGWMENHEYRITKLEEWKEERIQQLAILDTVTKGIAASSKIQDEKLDRLDSKISTTIISALSAALMVLIKIIIDIISKR